MSLTGESADVVLAAQSAIHTRTGKLIPVEQLILRIMELGWDKFKAEVGELKPIVRLVK